MWQKRPIPELRSNLHTKHTLGMASPVLKTGIVATASSVNSVSESVSKWSESLVCRYSRIEVNGHPVLGASGVTAGGGLLPSNLVLAPPKHRAYHAHNWSTKL